MLWTIRNLPVFIFYAVRRGTPLHLWPQAWRDVKADHLASVRKAVWELKCQGRIYEDEEGRLWPKK